MKPKPDLSQEELHQVFTYKDGMLFNKYKRSQVHKGQRAGSLLEDSGYRSVMINLKSYLEQRIIWIMHYGPIPEGMMVDHRDTIRDNNRIENLRLATNSQNKCNASVMKNNTSGYKGVSKQGGRWKAEIRINYKSIYLGLHATPELASEAYKKAAVQHHGEFARS